MTIAFTKGAGVTRIPMGFSWTTLIFGCLPSVFRGHISFAFWFLVIEVIALFTSLFVCMGLDGFLLTFAARIFLSSIRNARLHKHLNKQGWIVQPSATVIQFPVNDEEFEQGEHN